jgi:hypothetical protein
VCLSLSLSGWAGRQCTALCGAVLQRTQELCTLEAPLSQHLALPLLSRCQSSGCQGERDPFICGGVVHHPALHHWCAEPSAAHCKWGSIRAVAGDGLDAPTKKEVGGGREVSTALSSSILLQHVAVHNGPRAQAATSTSICPRTTSTLLLVHHGQNSTTMAPDEIRSAHAMERVETSKSALPCFIPRAAPLMLRHIS